MENSRYQKQSITLVNSSMALKAQMGLRYSEMEICTPENIEMANSMGKVYIYTYRNLHMGQSFEVFWRFR
jgi:hypothetical protein